MTPMIVEHPLLQHKLSILRNKQTGTKEFRDLVGEIATLLSNTPKARALAMLGDHQEAWIYLK